jgi:hypothetical protein
MEKRTSAITVRFTDEEKDDVLKALSVYGDPAVAARMILIGFAAGHREFARMAWPPESTPASNAVTPELLKEVGKIIDERNAAQLLAADPSGTPYTTKKAS